MNPLQHLFSFDRMITPALIRYVFIGTVVIEVLIGLGIMLGGGANVFFGLMFIVLAPIVSRVTAELTILFFQMNEKLSDIETSLATRAGVDRAA